MRDLNVIIREIRQAAIGSDHINPISNTLALVKPIWEAEREVLQNVIALQRAQINTLRWEK